MGATPVPHGNSARGSVTERGTVIATKIDYPHLTNIDKEQTWKINLQD